MVDFLGIGVQKGGTTWLFHQLAKHPQIAFPSGKELHFWNHFGESQGNDVCRWVKMLASNRPTTADGRPVRTGEITPAYALIPTETISVLRDHCPDIRLFISLRNPLERAWSAALMGLSRAEMFAHEASDAWFIDHFHSSASRQRGDYADCIERWRAVFPPDQLLILLHDEIATTPAAALRQLAGHLRIDAAGFAAIPPEDLNRVVVPVISGVHPIYTAQQGLPLRASLYEPLLQCYAPQIERLQTLLGRDLFWWKEPPCAKVARRRQRHELRADQARAQG
jgi:hypothetical protein